MKTPAPQASEPIDIVQLAREHSLLTKEEDLAPDVFPEMTSMSPRFFYRFLPVPQQPGPIPEYVYVPSARQCGLKGDEMHRYDIFLTSWNNTWEARGERPAFLSRDAPKQLRWVLKKGQNLRLVWRDCGHSYDPYAPLYHLLPRRTLDRFELPLLKRGIWPEFVDHHLLEHVLPADFDDRLQRAFTYHIWPLMGARGAPSCFSKDDPILLLSHNMDYWMPYIDLVAQTRALEFGRTVLENEKQKQDYEAHKDEMPPGVTLATPLRGGPLWLGEEEAMQATRDLVETADREGALRSILDAIRSNRVQDDFSERWSFEREDFERRLYSKRNKCKVTFVELDETIPVHGPESEVHNNLLWEDFLSLVDAKERRVVVCLRNGVTRVGEISKILGYANHSPVSKALARIRIKAKRFLNE